MFKNAFLAAAAALSLAGCATQHETPTSYYDGPSPVAVRLGEAKPSRSDVHVPTYPGGTLPYLPPCTQYEPCAPTR